MHFIQIATEQTTAVTDLFLAFVAFFLASLLVKKKEIAMIYWKYFFLFIGLGAFIGTLAHGLVLSDNTHLILWHLLYFSLGIGMAFMLATNLPKNLSMFILSMCSGLLFYLITAFISSSFIVFVVYAVPILFISAVVNFYKYFKTKEPSFIIVGIGAFLVILSGAVQALFKGEVFFIWVFDHNGLSHFVQALGLSVICFGVIRVSKVFKK